MASSELSDSESLAEMNEMYALIGSSLARWNDIEGSLAFLFALTLRADASYSMTAYHAVVSFEARLAMVNAVAKRRLKEHGDLLARWTSLSSRLTKKAKKRAEIAHCTVMRFQIRTDPGAWIVEALPFWSVSKLMTGFTHRPNKTPVGPKGVALSLGDLKSRSESFKVLSDEVGALERDVSRALGHIPQSRVSGGSPQKSRH